MVGKLVGLASECDGLLTHPDLAQDLHVLAQACDWLVIWHTMPAFDHLRARETEADEHAPTTSKGVERGHCHCTHRWGATCKLHDTRAELDAGSFCCKVSE